MNEVSPNVTKGDLDDLRLAANALVSVQNVYMKYASNLAELPETDAETYGPTHHWWTYVAGELQTSLRGTGDRLVDGAHGLLDAITAYAHVDGDNSKALTEAGEGYMDILSDPDKAGDTPFESVTVLDEKSFPEPDLSDKPHNWEENHE